VETGEIHSQRTLSGQLSDVGIAENTVFIVTWDGTIIAVDPEDLTELWRENVSNEPLSLSVVDNTAYTLSTDRVLRAYM